MSAKKQDTGSAKNNSWTSAKLRYEGCRKGTRMFSA